MLLSNIIFTLFIALHIGESKKSKKAANSALVDPNIPSIVQISLDICVCDHNKLHDPNIFICMILKLMKIKKYNCFPFISTASPLWYKECVGFGCEVTRQLYEHKKCVADVTEKSLRKCLRKELVHVTFKKSGMFGILSLLWNWFAGKN